MVTPPTLYLHIGLPKTATTYLQREVFPALTGLEYLGTPRGLFHGDQDLEHGQRTLTSCVRRSAVVWDHWGAEIFHDLLGPASVAGDRPSVLLSDEGIGRGGSRPLLLAAHLEGILRQAREWGFGGVRVLGAFRRQDHWLASHYAQISDRAPRPGQEDFEAMVRDTLDAARSRFGFGVMLDYEILCDRIGRVVGDENLLMIPYELLQREPSEFHNHVLRFLGAGLADAGAEGAAKADRRHNVRSRSGETWAIRAGNRHYEIHLRPGRLFTALRLPHEIRLTRSAGEGGTIHLTDELSAAVLRSYEYSNRALAERLRLDLADFGYFPERP